MSLLRKLRRREHETRGRNQGQDKRGRSGMILEALEPRVMLAADLAVNMMPTDLPLVNWGGDIMFDVGIDNEGTPTTDDLTSGSATVKFYIDTNQNGTLDLTDTGSGVDDEITSVVPVNDTSLGYKPVESATGLFGG